MKKKMILAVICVLFILGLAGCSSEPAHYSKKEVKRYVKDVFSVYSSTPHPYVDASETRFYEKQIGDNYINCVMVN